MRLPAYRWICCLAPLVAGGNNSTPTLRETAKAEENPLLQHPDIVKRLVRELPKGKLIEVLGHVKEEADRSTPPTPPKNPFEDLSSEEIQKWLLELPEDKLHEVLQAAMEAGLHKKLASQLQDHREQNKASVKAGLERQLTMMTQGPAGKKVVKEISQNDNLNQSVESESDQDANPSDAAPIVPHIDEEAVMSNQDAKSQKVVVSDQDTPKVVKPNQDANLPGTDKKVVNGQDGILLEAEDQSLSDTPQSGLENPDDPSQSGIDVDSLIENLSQDAAPPKSDNLKDLSQAEILEHLEHLSESEIQSVVASLSAKSDGQDQTLQDDDPPKSVSQSISQEDDLPKSDTELKKVGEPNQDLDSQDAAPIVSHIDEDAKSQKVVVSDQDMPKVVKPNQDANLSDTAPIVPDTDKNVVNGQDRTSQE